MKKTHTDQKQSLHNFHYQLIILVVLINPQRFPLYLNHIKYLQFTVLISFHSILFSFSYWFYQTDLLLCIALIARSEFISMLQRKRLKYGSLFFFRRERHRFSFCLFAFTVNVSWNEKKQMKIIIFYSFENIAHWKKENCWQKMVDWRRNDGHSWYIYQRPHCLFIEDFF